MALVKRGYRGVEVAEVHMTRIIRVDTKSERNTYGIKADPLTHARMINGWFASTILAGRVASSGGKLLLVTNVADLAPNEVLKRYRSRANQACFSCVRIRHRDRADLSSLAGRQPVRERAWIVEPEAFKL